MCCLNFSSSDNELPLSSIANILFPIDSQKIIKTKEDYLESTAYKPELNINSDYKSKTSKLSDEEQNVIDNLVNRYECDICGKIFEERYLIIEHFKRSLCFPESPSYFKNNSSKFHNKYNNTKKSILCNGSLVTKNIKECKICQAYVHKYKLLKRHQVLHTNKNNLEHDVNSKNSFEFKNAHCNKKQWKCQVCKKSFTIISTFKAHKHVHYKNKLFKCDKSNDLFRHLNSLKKHKIVHISNCQICNKRYSEPSSFTANEKIQIPNESKHIIKVNNSSKDYECSTCSKVFHKRSEIISHIFESHQEDYSKYSCDTCANLCVSLPDFVLRFEKKVLKCDICPLSKKFTSSQRLQQHYKWHIGINNFKCQYCPVSFSKYSVYLDHENTHVGEKPFRCHFCGKWFPVSSNLNIHLRFYNPFARNIGEKPLSKIPTLPRKRIHPKEKNQLLSNNCCKTDNKEYKCDLCMQVFHNQSQICAHILETHY